MIHIKSAVVHTTFFLFHNIIFIICKCQFLHPLCIHANVFSRKHYREYLVSLINSHSVDPAPIYSSSELLLACKRYKVEEMRCDGEDSFIYYSRLLEVSLRVTSALWCWAKIEFINWGLFEWAPLLKLIILINRYPNCVKVLNVQWRFSTYLYCVISMEFPWGNFTSTDVNDGSVSSYFCCC